MSDKPNCYECRHRQDIMGDVHSGCIHPAIKDIMGNPVSQVLALLGSVGRTMPIKANVKGINVTGNEHGISQGWFTWPFNFDPTWLEACDGFEEEE